MQLSSKQQLFGIVYFDGKCTQKFSTYTTTDKNLEVKKLKF
jgi:hypothetical protein